MDVPTMPSVSKCNKTAECPEVLDHLNLCPKYDPERFANFIVGRPPGLDQIPFNRDPAPTPEVEAGERRELCLCNDPGWSHSEDWHASAPTDDAVAALARLLDDACTESDSSWTVFEEMATAVLAAGYVSPEQAREREAAAVKAALLAAAQDFQLNTWADVITPALKTTGIPALAVGQAVVDWLRDRATRTERTGR